MNQAIMKGPSVAFILRQEASLEGFHGIEKHGIRSHSFSIDPVSNFVGEGMTKQEIRRQGPQIVKTDPTLRFRFCVFLYEFI